MQRKKRHIRQSRRDERVLLHVARAHGWQVQATLLHLLTKNNQIYRHVPSRSPPGVRALLSPGQVFLLAVMETSSRTLSARAPSIPRGLRSTKTRWLSVPPDRKIKHKPVHIWCEQRKRSSKSICITNCISLASNNSQAFYQTPGCSLSSARLVPLTWHSASLERCTVWTWEWKPAGTDISHQGCCKWKDWLLCVLWSVSQRSFFSCLMETNEH